MSELNINTPATPPEPEGHTEAMIAKAEGRTPETPPDADPERPDWLPEKFKTPEDLAKAYAELEKSRSKETETSETNEEPNAERNEADRQAAEETVSNAGFEMSELEQEFQQNGALTDETLAKLEKQGINRDMVDAYVAGQQAIAEQITSRVHDRVGGEEQFQSMIEWAKDGLTDAEARAYNAAVDSGDEAQMMLALDGLSAKYRSANGTRPNLLGGDNVPLGGEVFQSVPQLTEAMRDPRYSTDPAYRKEVEAKLARSSIF